MNRMAEYGSLPEIAFREICEFFFLYDTCIQVGDHIKGIIDFLEMKGYIVTTEVDWHTLALKPLGVKCREYTDSINWDVCFDKSHG
jgi:hypothetical protein